MAVQFWVDANKKQIQPDLFSTAAETLAKQINKERDREINEATQIRKFYDEVLRFDGLVRANPDEFNTLLPYLKMLNAKATYALGRKLISQNFKNFITESISQIQTQKDFEVFRDFFEAFIGFYRYYGEQNQERRGGMR